MASSGNFCTMNQVDPGVFQTITGGGLIVGGTGSSTADQAKRGATFYVQSGKWYWEVRQTVGGSSYGEVGISVGSAGTGTPSANSGFSEGLMYQSIAGTLSAIAAGYVGLGTVTTTSTGVSAISNNQVINIALDMDNRKLWFGLDGTYFNSGDPANGTNPQFSWTTDTFVTPTSRNYATNRPSHYNFGQDSTFGGNETAGGNADGNSHGDFHNTVPTGFLALCSSNLPISDDINAAETDDDYPAKQFGAYTYTGNSGTAVTVSTDFQPDLIWIKNRSATENHYLQDSSRGFGNSKSLSSSTTGVQGYNGGAPSSSGAQSVGSSSFQAYGNDWSKGTDNFVAWCWRANGGTTATNSSGSADSTVQANTKAGFSISLTNNYTAANGVTIGHGLGVKPAFYIHKPTGDNSSGGASQAFNWHVYHHSLGATKAMILNLSNSVATAIGYWNNTEPTTDVLSLGNLIAGNGQSLVYAWAEIDGYSRFGSFEGNANNGNGPFVYTGFRPKLIFIKDVDAGNEWYVQDTARETKNPTENFLEWDTSDAEQSKKLDILSNGFKPREDSGRFNDSHTYIYGAWADVSFKYNNTF